MCLIIINRCTYIFTNIIHLFIYSLLPQGNDLFESSSQCVAQRENSTNLLQTKLFKGNGTPKLHVILIRKVVSMLIR